MEVHIAQKLREARVRCKLTQEAVAEALGVTRQTVSNWENERSYPDIVSVIQLSDLYSVSLDELLKGDAGMIAHLDESTNVVRSKTRLRKVWQIGGYVAVWTAALFAYRVAAEPSSAMGRGLLAFFVVLPVVSLVDSFLIGADDGWENIKWLMPLFFGGMYALLELAAFWLDNGCSFAGRAAPLSWQMLLVGTVISLSGLLLGSGGRRLVRYLRQRNNLPE